MMDKKVQMMDAGTAWYRSDAPFGEERGRLKAEMEACGTVWEVAEESGKFGHTLPQEALPPSTAECDWFLDLSTPWRARYVSARMESPGEGRYAVVFKEGSHSTRLRGVLMALLTLSPLALPFLLHSGWYLLPALAASFGLSLLWMMPSRHSRAVVRRLIRLLDHAADDGAHAPAA